MLVAVTLDTAGAVVSSLTVSFAALGLLALSETEQEMLWVPSPETGVVQVPLPPVRVRLVVPSVQLGAPARPLPESLALIVTVTGAFTFQPPWPSGVCETDSAGATVSIRIGLTAEPDAVLPALSAQLGVTDPFEVSLLRIWLSWALTGPEPLSVQSHDTVTEWLVHVPAL